MVRYLFLSLNIFDGLLALAVAAVVYFVVIPLLNPVAQISLPPVKETIAPLEKQKASSQQFTVADYTVISEKNLLHPERKPPLKKQAEKAVSKPDVLLFGTLITDDVSIAFIEDKKYLRSARSFFSSSRRSASTPCLSGRCAPMALSTSIPTAIRHCC